MVFAAAVTAADVVVAVVSGVAAVVAVNGCVEAAKPCMRASRFNGRQRPFWLKGATDSGLAGPTLNSRRQTSNVVLTKGLLLSRRQTLAAALQTCG